MCLFSEPLASHNHLKLILGSSCPGHFSAWVFPASTGLIEEINMLSKVIVLRLWSSNEPHQTSSTWEPV